MGADERSGGVLMRRLMANSADSVRVTVAARTFSVTIRESLRRLRSLSPLPLGRKSSSQLHVSL